jgi:hypothetical protein
MPAISINIPNRIKVELFTYWTDAPVGGSGKIKVSPALQCTGLTLAAGGERPASIDPALERSAESKLFL